MKDGLQPNFPLRDPLDIVRTANGEMASAYPLLNGLRLNAKLSRKNGLVPEILDDGCDGK